MNSVTLYSNGTAVIRREYKFHDQNPQHILIPVRKSDLDDVVSSLSVYGDVTVTKPPTYTPTNAQETALTLNPASVLKDMATKLAGAAVEISAGTTYVGKLLGLHEYRRIAEGTVFVQCRLIVSTEKGVQQIEEASITAIRFTDAMIQSEIDKSLASSISQVRPDSSVVEMTLRPNAGVSEAIVTYATPVAAWKIRYQLRLSSQKAELEGQAVVDNDTDDDWTDTLVTVITGEPITFASDLAEIRRPARSRVNIVADHTTGAISPEPDIVESAMSVCMSAPTSRQMSAMREPVASRMRYAEQAQAEVRESGDFSIFSSPDCVTVGAKRSAIIPLFRTDISDAKPILFYRERHDAQRPFRAIRLRNQTTHALGRGIVEVSVDGDFQGKCVMEPTQAGEDVLLVYAKETGVRVSATKGGMESRRMAVRISGGNVYTEVSHRCDVVYQIHNSRPDAFALEIEHPRTMRDSRLSVTLSSGEYETTAIPSGTRISVTLRPKGRLSLTVHEKMIEEQQFVAASDWLRDYAITIEAPVGKNMDIEKCISIHEKIDNLQSTLNEQEAAAATIAQEQERLMKLIPSGHGDQANAWRTDLASAEQELREIKRSRIPALQGQLREAESDLRKALKSLQYEWRDELGVVSPE
jgi:hypothetical protein